MFSGKKRGLHKGLLWKEGDSFIEEITLLETLCTAIEK